MPPKPDAEQRRLADPEWKHWGTYLPERQWGTVREDYSARGETWTAFTYDDARYRVYRWGEDGILGWTDAGCQLCLAPVIWNGRDDHLKERLFGLSGPEGNHGEDVKELYFYLDATPTHSFARGLYKYPHAAYPYARFRQEARRRGLQGREFDVEDAGLFDAGEYFDLEVEYAKGGPEDVVVTYRVTNHGPAARLHLLAQLWLRNTWAWGREGPGFPGRGRICLEGAAGVRVEHEELGSRILEVVEGPPPTWLFTENETNRKALWGVANDIPYVRDAFHRRVVEGDEAAVNPAGEGSKAAAWFELELGSGEVQEVTLRLAEAPEGGAAEVRAARRAEADAFHAARIPEALAPEERSTLRQAYAGLLWTKQFYHLDVGHWLDGDPAHPPPPATRRDGPMRDWRHLHARDVLSMPDKWEYPWFAAWDLAFHLMPLSRLDPEFTKDQLLLLLSERYMHPAGKVPAYEFAFSDANPPVHAWAVAKTHRILRSRGQEDLDFLERAFLKLLIVFTQWVNRKDREGNHLFSGGFLGLDNIGVIDRGLPLAGTARLEQADATAWMGFFAAKMLEIALVLAEARPAYEELAVKFFEHFVHIGHAMNTLGGAGLWDEEDGFYHDMLLVDGTRVPLKARSVVGIIPLFAVDVLPADVMRRFPEFAARARWFEERRPDLAACLCYLEEGRDAEHPERLLAMVGRDRLERILTRVLDEGEFLSPYGVRSLSRSHLEEPFELRVGDQVHRVEYIPGESDSRFFGGNSNWRGPVWLPLNYLLLDALERYHDFYGEDLTVEYPTGSGVRLSLAAVSRGIAGRIGDLFRADPDGRRPWHGEKGLYWERPEFHDLQLFHEYFDGDTGRGLGASHQTGWTALITRFMKKRLRDM
jgi:hypothetical protein